MKEIKTFSQLIDIETEHFKFAIRQDLMFIRDFRIIYDGYALIIGADCKEDLELYFISYETYKKCNLQGYLEHYYGIQIDE